MKQIRKYDIKISRYDDVARMYLSLNDKQEAVHFFELSLKEEPHTVMEQVDILYHLCMLYESLIDDKNVSQCVEQLLLLQPRLLDAPPSPILLHSKNIRRIAQFYRRHGKKEEANALDQKIVDSLTNVDTKPNYWTLHKAVDTVKDAFYSKNYSRTVQIGLQILPLFSEEVDARMITGVLSIKRLGLEVRILIGRAKFLSDNFSEGLDYLQTIFESDLMKLDSGLRSVICKYLLFRPRYFRVCFPFDLHPYSIYQFGKGFLYYGLWYLPNIISISNTGSQSTYHTITPQFRSRSTEVISTGTSDSGLSIFTSTMFPWLKSIDKTVNNILESSMTSVLYGIGLVPFIVIQSCCCCCRMCIVIQYIQWLYKYFKFVFPISVCAFIALYRFHLQVV